VVQWLELDFRTTVELGDAPLLSIHLDDGTRSVLMVCLLLLE
jgi:hypothetical protein